MYSNITHINNKIHVILIFVSKGAKETDGLSGSWLWPMTFYCIAFHRFLPPVLKIRKDLEFRQTPSIAYFFYNMVRYALQNQ